MPTPPPHRHVTTGEDKLPKAGIFGDLEHVAGALDVGVKQRRRITQPAAGVDDAVVDVVDTGHRLAQRVVVPNVADEPRDGQVVDADRVGVGPHHRPDLMTVGYQLPCHMRAEKAVGADDQLRLCAHFWRPYWRIHAAASSGSVPSSWALRHHFIVALTKRSGL